MREFFEELGEGMREFQKETILEGGNNGGIFRGIRRRYERTSKTQYGQEEINPFP